MELVRGVVVSGRAMSLEQGTQVSMTTLRAATTHQILTKSVETLANPILPKPTNEGGGGDAGQKAVQTYHLVLETNFTTSHRWNAQHMCFEKPCMPQHGAWFPDQHWLDFNFA